MWADSHNRITACAECQFYAAKQGKAPVTEHITAERCGQKYAMDILHLSEEDGNPKMAAAKKLMESSKGKQKFREEEERYEYVLTVVDVYSRYTDSLYH